MTYIDARSRPDMGAHRLTVIGLGLGSVVALTLLGGRGVEPVVDDSEVRRIEFASPVVETYDAPVGFAADPKGQPYVALWRARLTESPPRVINRYLAQTEPWKNELVPILGMYAVPPEFIYLALLESGMDPEARSSADAVGIWQFTQETAIQYGLTVDADVDERLDELLSTDAAGRYLRDLYRRFGSWELAAAAYNAGPGRVERALAHTGYDNYWDLIEVRHLPAETRAYVPRFLAMVELANERASQRQFSATLAVGAD